MLQVDGRRPQSIVDDRALICFDSDQSRPQSIVDDRVLICFGSDQSRPRTLQVDGRRPQSIVDDRALICFDSDQSRLQSIAKADRFDGRLFFLKVTRKARSGRWYVFLQLGERREAAMQYRVSVTLGRPRSLTGVGSSYAGDAFSQTYMGDLCPELTAVIRLLRLLCGQGHSLEALPAHVRRPQAAG